MSESYIGLAPSYGIFEKQVIAGTTATTYSLDFNVAQATQLLVSIDGIVQEPDYAFTIGRSSSGVMQIIFSEALGVTTTTGNSTAGSTSITSITTTNLRVGQGITGTGIQSNTTIATIPTAGTGDGTITLDKSATSTASGTTFTFGARIFITYLGKQLLTPSTSSDATVPLVEHFNGDSSDVTFSLVRTPPNQSSILVFVDGVFQRGSGNAYTLSGATITFTAAPPTGTNNITVHYVATQNNSVPTVTDGSITNASINLDYSNATYRSPTVDVATQTSSFSAPQTGAATWTIKQPNTTAYYDVNSVLVILNGIMLTPTTDYTISTTTLTLAGGVPPVGSTLVIRYLPTTG